MARMLPHERQAQSRRCLLSFAATFAWADCEVDQRERQLVVELARELGSAAPEEEAARYLGTVPDLATIDPRSVPPSLAPLVRRVALEMIAADRRITESEMEMFFLLDALLPGGRPS